MVSNKSCIEVLLDLDANIESIDVHGYTPLCVAAEAGSIKVVEILLKRNSDIRHVTSRGHSAMYLAALNKHYEVLKYLQDHGGVFSTTDEYLALSNMNLTMLNTMKEYGVNFNAPDEYEGYTALHAFSAWHANEQIINWLLDFGGADINVKCNGGATPLHEAARWGKLNIVKLLISRGAEINVIANDSGTPLDWAIDYQEREVVDFLRRNGGIAETLEDNT